VKTNHDNVVQRLRDHVPQALAFLIDEHSDAVSRLVSRILAGAGSKEDAEECVSDVFFQAWHRAHEYDPSQGTVRSWLLMLAKYRALTVRRQLLRHAKQGLEVPDYPGDPVASGVLSRERQEALAACIKQLDPSLRDVIVCRLPVGHGDCRYWRQTGINAQPSGQSIVARAAAHPPTVGSDDRDAGR
jgi:RNA polymerase sigma-70 factor (ECF subfamily)